MFKNYFKTAWRSLKRNRTFSILNILGLSIGVACFLLIALYVLDEMSYDRFNKQADNIYRIDEHLKFGDFSYNGALVPAVMGPGFAKDFSRIAGYTRLKYSPNTVVRKEGGNIHEDRAVYADSTLFDVFSFEMIAGDKKTALREPHSLVLTETAARRYFGSLNIIGKTLALNEMVNYKITGVIKDMPRLSHFKFDLLMSISELEASRDPSWVNFNFQTYLLLKPHTDREGFEKQLDAAFQRNLAPQFGPILNTSESDFRKAGNYIHCNLIPLTDIHLRSHLSDELGTNGSIQYVYIFSAIAILILLIACVNFMNLSTASSANRAREVGVRKVLGGLKNNLITQFLAESFLACLLSLLIAMGIAALLLPFFNQLAGKEIPLSVLFSGPVLLSIFLLLFPVSLIAGSYPAFFLSSFQPIKVLKGNLANGFKGSALRNTLVVFQFTVSAILMIGTFVIYRQLKYVRDKDLGFSKEQVLIIQDASALKNNTKTFTNDLLTLPGVKNVTSSGFLPISGARNTQAYLTVPEYNGKNFTIMQEWLIDEQYLPAFQLQLKQGRNFSTEYPSDSAAVIINETAARVLGNVNPLDKNLYALTDLKGVTVPYKIIGVIRDFNFNSLHDEVGPLVMHLHPDNRSMAIRMSTTNITTLVDQIKSKWETRVSSQPFVFTFLDDEFNKQYNADQRTGDILLVFSVLAILIACLGLFGLVTFAAELRMKEIGIRKVLGARTPVIFALLSKDFLKLLLLSVCIASPIAWWAMNKWLQDFAYRISIQWWMFVMVGVICLLIALATISFQVIKAAFTNPVRSLRAD